MDRIEGFEPVANINARVLILGTMPSVRSLRQGFYYGHPMNAFWRIMSDILSESMPQTVMEKKRMLLAHNIALWDVCRSCVRPGSLDADIRDVAANDFSAFYAKYPSIRRILFNGAKAQELYRRYVSVYPANCESMRMPSTSPAYTRPYVEKLAQWRAGLEEIP
ncbi:MAG: DNA-deoxyinosine glycosylase [Clostridia bacterium]|nr:DNA-deoxyinosine glycosylase [Clostridia bacterium]